MSGELGVVGGRRVVGGDDVLVLQVRSLGAFLVRMGGWRIASGFLGIVCESSLFPAEEVGREPRVPGSRSDTREHGEEDEDSERQSD